MALGTAIVSELHLDDRGEVLQRWMAHHLAEQISKAEGASGAAKAKHEQSAVSLILKLWLHRRGLPDKADPLAGYRDALETLGRLSPDANPWLRHSDRPYVGILRDMHDAMGLAIVGGIALTELHAAQTHEGVKMDFLDPSEIALLAAFAKWLPSAKRPRPPRVVVVRETDAAPNDEGPSEVLPPSTTDRSQLTEEEQLRMVVADNLSRVHAELGRLLARWKKSEKEAGAGKS